MLDSPRPRLPLAFALAAVVALGLSSRAFPLFPAALANYPGDALWALMVVLLIAIATPRLPPVRLAAASLVVSFAVEVLQLVHVDWLDAIRATLAGRLALGTGYDPLDLVAYTVGVGVGLAADLAWLRLRSR